MPEIRALDAESEYRKCIANAIEAIRDARTSFGRARQNIKYAAAARHLADAIGWASR